MDKLILNSYIKQLFRESLNTVHYNIKGSAKEWMYKLGLQACKMAQSGISLTTIYNSFTSKQLPPKYDVILDANGIKDFKAILGVVKSVPIASVAKGKPYDQAHIVLISM